MEAAIDQAAAKRNYGAAAELQVQAAEADEKLGELRTQLAAVLDRELAGNMPE